MAKRREFAVIRVNSRNIEIGVGDIWVATNGQHRGLEKVVIDFNAKKDRPSVRVQPRGNGWSNQQRSKTWAVPLDEFERYHARVK